MAGQTLNYMGTRPFTLKAGAAVTANRAVKLDANGDVIHTTAITDKVVGISLQTVASGEDVELLTVNGVKAKATASAAVSIGDDVMPTASGAGKCSTASGPTAKSFGIALSAAAADGEIIEVLTRYGANGVANT